MYLKALAGKPIRRIDNLVINYDGDSSVTSFTSITGLQVVKWSDSEVLLIDMIIVIICCDPFGFTRFIVEIQSAHISKK